jgi:histidinol dehydrogenase
VIRILEAGDEASVAALLDRAPRRDVELERRVARIVATVRQGGDKALLAYARKFDRLSGPVDVTREEMRDAAAGLSAEVRMALRVAAKHIRHVARRQVPRAWKTTPAPGVSIEQRVTPLDRVGCYVPAGRYPLPSSLLMTAIPARVAGVEEVIVACPRPDATVMGAALEAGITRLVRLGGAHAIAALAYGTETIPKVDKIVGPGNAYVAAAKALVAADCAIDFFAGPSEILVLSVDGRPAWIAADLLAQAEHDDNARAIFVTPDRKLARRVAEEITRQMPESGPARTALARNGAIVIAPSVDAAVALSERMAPEHVVCDTPSIARRLRRAGTVFVGHYSAQASGDYITGSNHVLPTSGAARFRGGLHASDFVRVSSVQQLTKKGIALVGPTAATLADAEGLKLHAASIRARLGVGPGRAASPTRPSRRSARTGASQGRSRQ